MHICYLTLVVVYGVRLTFILTVLNALLMYFMSIFKVLKSIVEVRERTTRDFLCDVADGDLHYHLVA